MVFVALVRFSGSDHGLDYFNPWISPHKNSHNLIRVTKLRRMMLILANRVQTTTIFLFLSHDMFGKWKILNYPEFLFFSSNPLSRLLPSNNRTATCFNPSFASRNRFLSQTTWATKSLPHHTWWWIFLIFEVFVLILRLNLLNFSFPNQTDNDWNCLVFNSELIQLFLCGFPWLLFDPLQNLSNCFYVVFLDCCSIHCIV